MGAVMFVVWLGTLGTVQFAGAAPPVQTDLNGEWLCTDPTCGGYPQTYFIDGSGGYQIRPTDNLRFANLTVVQHGRHVVITSVYTAVSVGYTAVNSGTLSSDGNMIVGTFHTSFGQSGVFSITRAHPLSGSVASGDVLPLAANISTPGQVFHSFGHNLLNAAITVAFILFITFPATIFNQTFAAHYEEIVAMWKRFRSRFRLRRRSVESETSPKVPSSPLTSNSADTPGRVPLRWFLLVLLAGALLGGLLNSHFGLNRQSAAGLGSTLVAFAFGATVSWFISRWFRRRNNYPIGTYLEALPLGLLVAALCVLISRISHFEPGYLYGVVISIGFAEKMQERHNAYLTAISVLSTLGVALVAWFLWIPVNHVALEHNTNLILATLDDVLGSIFIGGLVGSVIGLLPLEFMPGGTLAKWRKDVWAGVMFLALFLLIQVELRPASGPAHAGGAPLVTVITLFLLFGGGTFAMRYYFAHHATPSDPTTPAPLDAATASVPNESEG